MEIGDGWKTWHRELQLQEGVKLAGSRNARVGADSLQGRKVSLGEERRNSLSIVWEPSWSGRSTQEPPLGSRAGLAEVPCATTVGVEVCTKSACAPSQVPSRTTCCGRTLPHALFITFFFYIWARMCLLIHLEGCYENFLTPFYCFSLFHARYSSYRMKDSLTIWFWCGFTWGKHKLVWDLALMVENWAKQMEINRIHNELSFLQVEPQLSIQLAIFFSGIQVFLQIFLINVMLSKLLHGEGTRLLSLQTVPVHLFLLLTLLSE